MKPLQLLKKARASFGCQDSRSESGVTSVPKAFPTGLLLESKGRSFLRRVSLLPGFSLKIGNGSLQFLEAGCSLASMSCASHQRHGENYGWLQSATSRESPSLGDIGALSRECKGALELCVPPRSAGGTRDGVTTSFALCSTKALEKRERGVCVGAAVGF